MTSVHPSSVVDSSVQLAEDVVVGPNCVLRGNVSIAAGGSICANAYIEGNTTIGKNCSISPFVSLGTAPQHLKYRDQPTALIIGDDVIIREHVTVNRGTAEDTGITRVGSNVSLFTASHVAHDCVIGDHTIMINNASVGGHVHVGDHVVIGGLAGIHQHVRIGRHAMIAGLAPVQRDIAPFTIASRKERELDGINIVGLKQRGFAAEVISALRATYEILTDMSTPTLADRISAARHKWGHFAEVSEMLAFIGVESKRGIAGFQHPTKTR